MGLLYLLLVGFSNFSPMMSYIVIFRYVWKTWMTEYHCMTVIAPIAPWDQKTHCTRYRLADKTAGWSWLQKPLKVIVKTLPYGKPRAFDSEVFLWFRRPSFCETKKWCVFTIIFFNPDFPPPKKNTIIFREFHTSSRLCSWFKKNKNTWHHLTRWFKPWPFYPLQQLEVT